MKKLKEKIGEILVVDRVYHIEPESKDTTDMRNWQ